MIAVWSFAGTVWQVLNWFVMNLYPNNKLYLMYYLFTLKHNTEEFEDTKGVIRILKSKDRQHNEPKKKYKRTNNDLQTITHKTKDRVTQTPLKTWGELGCWKSSHVRNRSAIFMTRAFLQYSVMQVKAGE